jgi:hypothetical protein
MISVLESLHPGALVVTFFSEDMTSEEQASLTDRAVAARLEPGRTFHLRVALSAPRRRPELVLDEDGAIADGEATAEVLQAVAHFGTADVFIMAVSMLSHAAAILNKHCVVYTRPTASHPGVTSIYLMHEPLSSWLDVYGDFEAGRDVRMRAAAFFTKCLRRDQ